MNYRLLCLLLLTGSCLFSAPQKDLFSTAYKQSLSGDDSGAIALYLESLGQEGHSAARHFNLANAYARQGDTGRAVLHYRKAFLLDPRDSDIRTNLALTLAMANVPAPQPDRLTQYAWAASMTFWAWWLASGFWIAAAGGLARWLFSVRHPGVTLAMACGGLMLCASLPALWVWHEDRTSTIALHDTPLLVAPARNSPREGMVRSAETLQPLETHHDYVRVQTATGLSGWIPAESAGRLWE